MDVCLFCLSRAFYSSTDNRDAHLVTNAQSNLTTWDESDDEIGGLKLAFAPVAMVGGVMAATCLINIVCILVVSLIGETLDTNDWSIGIRRTLKRGI